MYVVDGYNLQHALARHKGLLPADWGRARARLLELLAHLARRESVNMRVFFDGTPGQLSPGELNHERLQVTFCGDGPESADRAVREHVESARNAARLRVVSSDSAVATACRLAGARIMPAQDMAARLAKLSVQGRTPRAGAQEKPARGGIGRLEREMLDEIGDLKQFEQNILRELEDQG
ncbi:MAG: NYN domain-containing protein [Planctomycetes bacterium]|jgi:predicted RNA-binding protein with PIN domain|nr:NYN domain-containing protein [Planctomycetota bacterium]MCL4729474.1 NYN domain-containing protein [Planctomycetota bacterium]